MTTTAKTKSEIAAMRYGGQILAKILHELSQNVSVGITTKDIAEQAKHLIKQNKVEAAFLNYQGFPDVICTSINSEVVHGIPSKYRIINDGDIVSLDLGIKYKGLITDGALTVIAGKPKSEKHVKLLEDTKKSLDIGIQQVYGGVRTGDIGSEIEKFLNSKNYGIVRDLVGHGVGRDVHEDPSIPNYGRANSGEILTKNMTVALEPMVTLGSDFVRMSEDGWTILTVDGSVAAHFEHTILVLDEGAEVLTSL